MPAPRLLLTSAQHLSAELRTALGRRCRRLRSSTTTRRRRRARWPGSAWSDAPGRFHVLAPDVWLEPDGDEVVVTRLRPSVLPLLRYRPGDTGTVRA